MTMHSALHPDDERLAAYAGGDADAFTDSALVEHLAACDRCRAMVEELTLLHDALAALPDLAPSRPLRLIPPVPAPAARRVGPLEWLRRLAAPAMAAGAGLVLIGAVGASGVVNELGLKAADRTTLQEASGSNGAAVPVAGGGAQSPVPAPGTAVDSFDSANRSDKPRSAGAGSAPSQVPGSSTTEGLVEPVRGSSGGQPWLTLLVAGLALFGISAVLRYSLTPRAA